MKLTLQERARSRAETIQDPAGAVRLRLFTAALLRELAARLDELEGLKSACPACYGTGRRFPFIEPGCRAFDEPCPSCGGKAVAYG